MRDYGKVHTSFWTSATTRDMSEDARTLALYLLTSPHSTIAGVFRLPDGYVCEDLQWSPERVAEAFKETLAKGFANRCETTKWVWICKHLEWNPPENPNQRKAAAKLGTAIPDECVWKPAFMRVSGELLGLVATEIRNPCETLSEPFLNQEQEQEQEQKKEPPRKRVAKSALPAGFGISDAVQAWAKEHGYGNLDKHLKHFIGYATANGKTYASWDQALMNAIRDDWAKVRAGSQKTSAEPWKGGK